MIKAFDEILLGRMPGIYETVNVPFSEKVVQMHIFRENADWYIVEYDPLQRLFYGYADVHPGPPRWECFSLDEIADCWLPSLSRNAELDPGWKPKKAKEIPEILGGE